MIDVIVYILSETKKCFGLQYDTIRYTKYVYYLRSLKSWRDGRPNLAHGTETKKKQGVALTGRNRTGPLGNVGRPTAHAPGGRPGGGDRPHARRPTRLRPARRQRYTDVADRRHQQTTDDDDDRQTPANKTIVAHYAGQ